MKQKIEPATLDDLPQLADLLGELFALEPYFTPDRAKQLRGLRLIIERPEAGCILVVREGPKILAMVNLLYTVSTAEGGPAILMEDFIVRADGSPSLIHAGSTVSGFEYAHKNLQLYAYYGGIYAGRNTALDANGTSRIGYGYQGSGNGQNRTTQEGTVGWTQTWWRDGKYGAFQTMFQYAYFYRNPWYVTPTSPGGNNAHESAVWFNLRYVLPGTAPTIKY